MGNHKIVEVIAKVARDLDSINLVNFGDKQLQRNRALPALDPPLSICRRLDPCSHKRSHAGSPTIGKNDKHSVVICFILADCQMWLPGRIAVAYKGILLPGEGRTHIHSVLTMKEESSKRCLTRFKCPFLTTFSIVMCFQSSCSCWV